jgi:hypothetical protein
VQGLSAFAQYQGILAKVKIGMNESFVADICFDIAGSKWRAERN